jgi:hypothetical protein
VGPSLQVVGIANVSLYKFNSSSNMTLPSASALSLINKLLEYFHRDLSSSTPMHLAFVIKAQWKIGLPNPEPISTKRD